MTFNKDFDGALADLAEAERIDPVPPQAAMHRCMTYTAMGKFAEAIADCNTAIEKAPKSEFALCSRAEAYLAKGDLDAALRDFNFVLSLNPNNVRAHAGRGQLFEKKHDLAQARADYRSASFALTPFDEIDIAISRTLARERLAALTPQTPGGASNARRIALIIGNGAYRNVHQLNNPPRDARLIAGALRDVGFQTVTLSNDLTRDKFFEALKSFASEAEKADWAVVYYAGHGFEIGGVNYLVPVDARLAADKDAETEAVALEQVLAAVGGARKLRLVLLDACRDNPFAPTMQRTIALKLVDKGFSNIEPGAGFMVVYAAKHGETALDGDGVDSPFAVAVARDIKEPRVEVRKALRHRPRRRLEFDQARAAALHLRLAAWTGRLLFCQWEVISVRHGEEALFAPSRTMRPVAHPSRRRAKGAAPQDEVGICVYTTTLSRFAARVMPV